MKTIVYQYIIAFLCHDITRNIFQCALVVTKTERSFLNAKRIIHLNQVFFNRLPTTENNSSHHRYMAIFRLILQLFDLIFRNMVNKTSSVILKYYRNFYVLILINIFPNNLFYIYIPQIPMILLQFVSIGTEQKYTCLIISLNNADT